MSYVLQNGASLVERVQLVLLGQKGTCFDPVRPLCPLESFGWRETWSGYFRMVRGAFDERTNV
jgi:hypothetical protein